MLFRKCAAHKKARKMRHKQTSKRRRSPRWCLRGSYPQFSHLAAEVNMRDFIAVSRSSHTVASSSVVVDSCGPLGYLSFLARKVAVHKERKMNRRRKI